MTSPTWDPIRWQQVAALFKQALDLEPEQRRALIQQIRRDTPDIAPAVERMLAADAAFASDTPPTAMSMVMEATDPALPAGTQLGTYEIESCLGTGGMGRVYRARRTAGDVTQTVAIKCLRFSGRDWDATRRFLRERKILATLTHPNIARFLDAGADADGQPFVVMEYIDGVAITDFVRSRRLSLNDRLGLLSKVLNAVAYLHRQLIVHRDIKPSNVLVDASGEPFLLDFGIAKPLPSVASMVPAEGETALENRIFSLAHAAPEQLRGAAVGIASDIYALGVLAYELLSGQPPFVLTGLAFAEAEREILQRLPPTLSSRVLKESTAPDQSDSRAWSRALGGDLDNIILHALKKEPGERYPTVEAFAEDLRRVIDSEPISLRLGQRSYRARLFVRRHRLAVAMAAGLLLALSGGSAALWLQNRAIEAERDTALVERRRAEALNGLLLNAFEAADPSRNRGNEVTAREVLDQAARRVDSPEIDAATRAAMLVTIADVYTTLGLPADAATAAQSVVNRGTGIPPLTRARAARALALAELNRGHIDAAAAALSGAARIELAGDAHDIDTESIAQAQVAAELLIARGLGGQALEQYESLYATAKSKLGDNDPMTLSCGVALAERLRVMREPAKSGLLVEELLGVIPDHRHTPLGVRLLGDRIRYQRDLRQFEQSGKSAVEYVEVVRRLYGERHRTYISSLDLLAKTERDVGNFDGAITHIRQAIGILLDISASPDSTSHATLLNNLAHTLNFAGRFEEAVDTARRSVDVALRVLPTGHNNIAVFRNTLAQALVGHGDFAEALIQLDQTEAIFAAQPAGNSPGVFRALADMYRAEALLGLGRRKEAEIAFARGWPRLNSLDETQDAYRIAMRLRNRLDEPH
jgi:eukaryotic-like serine/threonine-protein kinase